MACKKCDPHEICEECPEWIFTLADLIMCMMGLFVLLWVLKESGSKAETPQQAQQQEAEWFRGFQQGFQGYIPTDTNDRNMLRKVNGPGAEGAAKERPETPEGTENSASIIRPGREVTTGGKLLFAPAKSDLTPELKKRLDVVAELIRGHRQITQIKGHAARDDLGADAPSGKTMDLSLRRAQAVADYLVSKGVEPEILRVQGCGAFEPVKQGDSSAAAQSLNRRVEVFVSDMLVDQLQDRRATVAAPLPAPRAKADEHHD